MSATPVQRNADHTSASSNQATVALSATGAGSDIHVAIGAPFSGELTVTAVQDNIGNTYTQSPGAAAVDSFFGHSTDIWRCLNATAGVTLITVTFSGTHDNKYVFAVEVSGMPSAALDDADHVNDGVNVDPSVAVTGPTLTGSGTDHFGIAIACSSSGISENPATGNEFDDYGDNADRSPDWDAAACVLITATPGSHTPVWTVGGDSHTCVSAAIYKSSGGGGGGSPLVDKPAAALERPFNMTGGRR